MQFMIDEMIVRIGLLCKKAARYHFYHNNMRTSDLYHQWGLYVDGRFPSKNITDCHKNQEPWENQLKVWRAKRDENFIPQTREQAERVFYSWTLDPNKHQIAAAAADFINRFDLDSCIELGCHGGALIALIDSFHVFNEKSKEALKRLRYIGIEPDQMPVEFGKQLPNCQIEFHLGDHRKLAELSGKFDLLICSYTLCLNDEPVIREVFDFASKACRFIFLAEDLANMNEDKPVIRRHYIIHPYAKLLKEYGFVEIDRIFLENANEAANGILISENRN